VELLPVERNFSGSATKKRGAVAEPDCHEFAAKRKKRKRKRSIEEKNMKRK